MGKLDSGDDEQAPKKIDVSDESSVYKNGVGLSRRMREDYTATFTFTMSSGERKFFEGWVRAFHSCLPGVDPDEVALKSSDDRDEQRDLKSKGDQWYTVGADICRTGEGPVWTMPDEEIANDLVDQLDEPFGETRVELEYADNDPDKVIYANLRQFDGEDWQTEVTYLSSPTDSEIKVLRLISQTINERFLQQQG